MYTWYTHLKHTAQYKTTMHESVPGLSQIQLAYYYQTLFTQDLYRFPNSSNIHTGLIQIPKFN